MAVEGAGRGRTFQGEPGLKTAPICPFVGLLTNFATGPKNALFAGSDGGAAHWAVIASLIETCKLIGVEPRAYLADVISRIVNGHPQSRLDELLPWAYPITAALKAAA
jgi:IS66 C-terminal element